MPDLSSLRSPSQELALVDLVERLERYRTGRWAVQVHLSRLLPVYRRDSFLRIATETFGAAVLGLDGQLFLLNDNEIFFVARDVTPTLLRVPVERIKTLFPLDPIFARPLAEASCVDNGGFSTLYNLELDYEALLQEARARLTKADQARLAAAQRKTTTSVPLRPEALARLDQTLATLDVAALTRRQTVCTLIDDGAPELLFDEVYVSIEDLQNTLLPGSDLAANVWLFRYLTATLDHRMMFTLMRDGVGATTRPFSVNLNVASVLSPLFPKFEAVIAPQLRGRLVVEMNTIDVFSDMNGFLFARDYLREHGFRICLDGLTHHTLPYYDREKLGFDLVKLHWTPDSLDTMQPEQLPMLRTIVREVGVAHTILCRCDDQRALDMGRELGIVMFQGRAVDRLLKAPAPPPKKPDYVLRYR
jgi:EAL domain-containing protein (putative c-di-GMP-specific phosphodiesterase class I)